MADNENIINHFDIDLTIQSIVGTMLDKRNGSWKFSSPKCTCDFMFFVLEGEFTAQVNDDVMVVKKNQLLYIAEGMDYFSKSISPTFSYYCIYFHLNEEDRKNNPLALQSIYTPHMHEKFKGLFRSFYNEYTTKAFGYRIKCKMILYDIMRNLMVEQLMSSNEFSGYYTIKNGVNYINCNYMNENISVSDLAEMCDITPTYFIHVFHEIYSTTPKQYIINLKMTRAAELLEYSEYSINEIGAQLGYPDPAYFSAAFKRYFGVSPLKYRTR